MAQRDDIAKLLSRAFEDTCRHANCKNCEYATYGEECRVYLYADMILIAGFRKEKGLIDKDNIFCQDPESKKERYRVTLEPKDGNGYITSYYEATDRNALMRELRRQGNIPFLMAIDRIDK